MADSKDPAEVALKFKQDAEKDDIYGSTSLSDIKAQLLNNKNRPLRRSLTMRDELKSLGIVPSYLVLEIMQEAMTAFKEGRGVSEMGDPGPAYLAIAMRGADTLARYNYASMKAVQITLDEAKKHFDASDPKQLLKAVVDDPFFTDEQREELAKFLEKKKDIKTLKPPPGLPSGNQPIGDKNNGKT